MFTRLLVFVLFAAAALADNITVVKGVVASDESLMGNHLVVNLISTASRRQLDRAYVGNDGSFEFRDVPAGSYTVELAASNGDSIRRETISLSAPGDGIEIRLPGRGNKPSAGKVSARELRHPLTPKSKRLFAEARKASERGEYFHAIDILRGVLSDEAAVPYARMNLGVAYIRAGQAASAVPELQEAVRLLPDDAVARTNLAYALLMTNRIDAAEAECRRALQIDKNSAKARWVMGWILLSKGSRLEEAVENLHLASREIPKARMMLAQFYERSGQKDQAVRELREYLPLAAGADRAAVEQWLNKLAAK